MTSAEELAFNTTPDHILECCLDGLSSYFTPTLFDVDDDDPYISSSFNYEEPWWLQSPDLQQVLISSTSPGASTSAISTDDHIVFDHQKQPSVDSTKKRKALHEDESTPQASETYPINQITLNSEAGDEKPNKNRRVAARKLAGKRNKKALAKPAGANSREGRWAEYLLNPCAAAIAAGNFSRVQHFLIVLNELASPTGNANHRLADHGLRALRYHLSSPNLAAVFCDADTFSSAKPQFFKDSLINFNDINPWFRIPNCIANSSILQILAEQDRPRNLHILDIGVSHGVQWPTLFAELNSLPDGLPPLVRLTVVNPTTNDNDQSRDAPFTTGPPGYSFTSKLVHSAKAGNINLKIDILDNYPLQSLNSEVIHFSPDETLIICAQFRLHNLNHMFPDDRTRFLTFLKSLEPKGVILSENNADCSCRGCGDFTTAFSRRVDYLWRFLDSTGVAYRRQDSDERRMMEGEAKQSLGRMPFMELDCC